MDGDNDKNGVDDTGVSAKPGGTQSPGGGGNADGGENLDDNTADGLDDDGSNGGGSGPNDGHEACNPPVSAG